MARAYTHTNSASVAEAAFHWNKTAAQLRAARTSTECQVQTQLLFIESGKWKQLTSAGCSLKIWHDFILCALLQRQINIVALNNNHIIIYSFQTFHIYTVQFLTVHHGI